VRRKESKRNKIKIVSFVLLALDLKLCEALKIEMTSGRGRKLKEEGNQR
jgi:hypothetical protein